MPSSKTAGLGRLADRIDLGRRLGPIFETITQVKRELPDACAMLGFCGAPWTVASYMIACCCIPDPAPSRLFAYRYPVCVSRAHRPLGRSVDRLSLGPIDAGVEAVQIFESFAAVRFPKAFLLGLVLAGADAEHHRRPTPKDAERESDRLRKGERARPFGDRGSDGSERHRHRLDALSRWHGTPRMGRRRCKAISIPWALVAGGKGWRKGSSA